MIELWAASGRVVKLEYGIRQSRSSIRWLALTPTRCSLLRVHPIVRSRHLDGQIRKEKMQGRAVRCAPVIC
jgi:hypothetical protein